MFCLPCFYLHKIHTCFAHMKISHNTTSIIAFNSASEILLIDDLLINNRETKNMQTPLFFDRNTNEIGF